MATQLALNLTHDAIDLLHDTGAGWAQLGTAQLTAADFTTQLSALQDLAARIGGSEFQTLLIIPDSQILFTSASATGLGQEADAERVRKTLHGATPYAVSELAYDWSLQDDRLRIGVVALETLAEAESFAKESGFRPIGFTALAPEGTFDRAPWFGATSSAPAALKADGLPTVQPPIALSGPLSAKEIDALVKAAQPKADEKPKPQSEADDTAKAPPVPADTSAAVTADPQGSPPKDAAPAAGPDQDKPAADDKTSTAKPGPKAAASAPKSAAESVTAKDGVPPKRARTKKKPAARPKDAAPSPPKTQAKPSKKTPPPARMPPAPPLTTAAPASPPAALSEPAAAPSQSASASAESDTAPPIAFTSIRARRDIPAAPEGAKTTGKATSEPQDPAEDATQPSVEALARVAARSLNARRGDAASTSDGSPPAQDAPADGEADGVALTGLMERIKRAAPAPQSPPPPKPRDAAAQEAETLTVFGARAGQQDAGAAPGRAGLIVTGALVLILLLIGVWAGIAYRAEIEAWLNGGDASDTTLADLPPAFSPTGDSLLATPAPVPAPAPSERGLTAPAQPRPSVMTSAPPSLAAPQVTRPVVPTPIVPRLPEVSSADQRIARAPSQPAPAPTSVDTSTDTTEAFEASPEELADSEEPGLTLLSAAETRARYAATGIWQSAPPQPRSNTETEITQLYLAAIDPIILGADAVDLPRDLRQLRDTAPARQSNPTAPGADILLGADGLVVPSPGGTLNPDGILVYAGPPPSGTPPRRPGLSDPPVITTPGLTADLRPRSRPQTLSETTQRARLGGRTLQELAGLRPLQRPASVQEAAAAQRAEAEIIAAQEAAELAIKQRAEAEAAGRAGASPLAITVSLSPRARPSNLVAQPSATANGDDADAPAGPAVVRSQRVQPSAPTPVSVARQATVDNGIRLNRMNLIGIFGTPNDRSALVRLPSGRLLRLKVGDRLDGGRVGAIGDDALRYTKGGRDITLEMPRG